MEQPFRFKQFAVRQDRCAMKIGTDGVLLGAWTEIRQNTQSILDVGAGTGIIALMMAQRSDAMTIDAVEAEDAAFEQCVSNFEESPWNDRLFCYHADFMEFAEEMKGETYDLIISNPPYFESSHKEIPLQSSRAKARFTDSLSFEQLLSGAASLLGSQGRFAVILPFDRKEVFIKIAENRQLFPCRITDVKGRAATPFKRSLLQFCREDRDPVKDELIIEKARHQYTAAYKQLTRDFYLHL